MVGASGSELLGAVAQAVFEFSSWVAVLAHID
jgi:hypothetical protein